MTSTARARNTDRYLPAEETARLLSASVEWRIRRRTAPDMLTTTEAAQHLATSHVTINNWINDRRCIAVEGPTRGRKLPRWQFEPAVFDHLAEVLAALGDDVDGWMQLAFFETPLPALSGRTPRQALEQGETRRVTKLAAHYATSDA